MNIVIKEYRSIILEPVLRPEYEEKLKKIKKGKFVKVSNTKFSNLKICP
jgi:hypothetical protein